MESTKAFKVEMVMLSRLTGQLFTKSFGDFLDEKEAEKKMRTEYERELKMRGLENNNAQDESGNSVPGGYYSSRECGIYDYATFAFDQLLEVIRIFISEIELRLPVSGRHGVFRAAKHTLTVPSDGKGNVLLPGKTVWVLVHRRAQRSDGRVYKKPEVLVCEGKVASVIYDTCWYADVILRIQLEKGQHYPMTNTFAYGVDLFLTKEEAEEKLQEAQSESAV